MLENALGNFEYGAVLYDRVSTCDLSDDFTLPDYMPAIGRVITTHATVAPPSRYLGSGGVEYAGGIRYRMMYESADDKSIWCAELPAEYDTTLAADRDGADIPNDPSLLSGYAEAQSENVSARVTAPRKLTIRSRVKLHAVICGACSLSCEMRGEVPAPNDLYALEGNARGGHTLSGTSGRITCRNTFAPEELGFSSSDNIRIVSCRGDVFLSQVQNVDGGADCRGDVIVTMFICREGEGERPRRITEKLPFAATVPFDGSFPNGTRTVGLRGWGVCPTVSATPDESGVTVEADPVICVEAAGITPLNYLKDIYSGVGSTEPSSKKITLRAPVACFIGNATISGNADLSETGLDGVERIADISASVIPEIESELTPEGRLTLNGKLKAAILGEKQGELMSGEAEIPFRYVADLPEAANTEGTEISVIASVCDCRGRTDVGGLLVDGELSVAVKITSANEIKALCEANFTASPSLAADRSKITVCYPAASETLWDIAKRYRRNCTALAAENSLDPSLPSDSPVSLSNTKFLII